MLYPAQVVKRQDFVARALTAPQLAGLGCGSCGGNCASCQGMGAVDLSSLMNNDLVKYGAIAVVGLIVVGALVRPGKSDYQKAVDSAREEYRSALATARKKYPRAGQRVARALPF